ncbi:type II secretion system protein [Vibrio cholerae]|uniref:Type II secretion system protein n=1 Tax=Vibrio paracholerae TaxID=650003 RepID=A0ABD7FYH5_9VIBR|nr:MULTISPECIES: type II secretion system protein [Vibrio]MBN7279614.1 prepilin-type N-terminal cleavage/methylation domain-containing protein [Vibrio paracholerae]MBN7282378.1 prepilin-type N-terminal cleavage/methylation domain-containing protein [Vibrio paracholerae]MBP8549337.1 prepilin-type N-terminal cleavage/methylation domain-containing protein [Vibrio paracholerae]MEB5520496.1 prepilin-type N-terminal cleavage/methylation domain-containing protein [Vibrio cholerae]OFJ27219.1 MSHA biog
MKRQGGFTLIELVVVIVILGILAVTAAPRFLNLQGDAREASLQGLKGAMQGAAGIVYGRAALDGKEGIPTGQEVTIGSDNVALVWGYPAANANGIGLAVSGLNSDWSVVASSATAGSESISYSFKNGVTGANATKCSVTYSLFTTVSNAQPTISVSKCD